MHLSDAVNIKSITATLASLLLITLNFIKTDDGKSLLKAIVSAIVTRKEKNGDFSELRKHPIYATFDSYSNVLITQDSKLQTVTDPRRRSLVADTIRAETEEWKRFCTEIIDSNGCYCHESAIENGTVPVMFYKFVTSKKDNLIRQHKIPEIYVNKSDEYIGNSISEGIAEGIPKILSTPKYATCYDKWYAIFDMLMNNLHMTFTVYIKSVNALNGELEPILKERYG